MSSIILFEDIFVVDKLDPDGKKFDKVTRIEARSENCDMFMHLDVIAEMYPTKEGERFAMAFANTLNLDGTPDTGDYAQGGKGTLAEKYKYIMHGKLYKISEKNSGKVIRKELFVSYGGLLMILRGDPSRFARFELDQNLFLLMKKL